MIKTFIIPFLAAVLAVLAVSLSSWIVSLLNRRKKHPPHTPDGCDASNNPQKTDGSTIARQLNAIVNQLYAYKEQHHSLEEKRKVREIVAIIFAAIAAAFFYGQQVVMQGQLDQMQQDSRQTDILNRPYIFISFDKTDAIGRWISPTLGPPAEITFRLTNYGKTPAIIKVANCLPAIADAPTLELITSGLEKSNEPWGEGESDIIGANKQSTKITCPPYPMPTDPRHTAHSVAEKWAALNARKIWFIALVDYDGVTGSGYQTTLCMKADMSGPYGEVAGNGCDEHR
jgi:hypothetical protein